MKFTIIIPAYNSAEFITSPLDSLEAQTYKDFEVLIINDGSTDNLREVVKPYLEANKNWKLIRKKNGNWGSVINYVRDKKLARGEYVTILDSDDWFQPTILEIVSKYQKEVIVTGMAIQKNNKLGKMPVYFGRSRIVKRNRVFTPMSMPHGKFYKKSLFYKMSPLAEGVSYQDTVLFNDMASKTRQVYFINKPLAVWWVDRIGNSTNEKWGIERVTEWLKTCERVISLKGAHNETHSWALMYLWELSRHYKYGTTLKVAVNTRKAKFKWIPFGARNLSKIYFKAKTKKYRK